MLNNRHADLNTRKIRSSERLSTGVLLNRASDAPSGLAVYQELHKRLVGLEQASRNTQDGMSLLQTVDGSLQEVQNNLKRMKDLAIQSNSDTLTTLDRKVIQQEINQIKYRG